MTPMQEQYNRIKNEYADSILLFRLGDFYETFHEDAKKLSKILGITLTSRGKGEDAYPMAGIPHHSLDNYLPKLLSAKVKVAIADQVEEAEAGKLVDRQVTKIITPGTVTHEKSLEKDNNNYIGSFYFDNKTENFYLSFCDITTGEFKTFKTRNKISLNSEINKIFPAEMIVKEKDKSLLSSFYNGYVEIRSEQDFDSAYLEKTLQEHFIVKNLKGFGINEENQIISVGSLFKYIKDCQKTELNHIKKISVYNNDYIMHLDPETIKNLELVFPQDLQNFSATVLYNIDECITSMGKRLLRKWILNPLIDPNIIKDRLDSVEYFYDKSLVTEQVRDLLDNIYDIERLSSRLGLNSINPKDLVALKNSIKNSLDLVNSLNDSALPNRLRHFVEQLKTNHRLLDKLTEFINNIEQTIDEEPSTQIGEGRVIKEGFNSQIDEYRDLAFNSKKILTEMQIREVESTGISSLKVTYNKVFGYYIEVTKTNINKVPAHYIRKQTLANAERYITEELKQIEDKIINAEQSLFSLEQKLYLDLIQQLVEFIEFIQEIASIVSEIDVISNLGFVARKQNYTKPILSDKPNYLKIDNGRHIVVEKLTKEFTPNSTEFNDESLIHILTGPNMSGKSTYIRQVALITLIAQIGSFVPADKVEWNIVDRIYTRVGASDNLAKGESTFMVEMTETANILNNASDKSLVILDEIGRGTSTYDGVAIAWSVISFIKNKIKARTLFATHYHELTSLESNSNKIKNFNVKVVEDNGKIIFQHKIISGAANKSYGIHVAELAGIPKEVTDNAYEILKQFEDNQPKSSKQKAEKNDKKLPSKPKSIHPEQLGFGV